MKIHIAYQFKAGPFGGANQFLQALKEEFKRHGVLAPQPNQADVLLANANPGNISHLLRELPKFRRNNPGGAIIIRIDGPIHLLRGQDRFADRTIARLVHLFADGVVFQSQWSRRKNKAMFNLSAPNETVIHNAPDPAIFYPKEDSQPASRKIKIIAASWSPNPRKGFSVYKYLDENLDWRKYEMTFVGNSPIPFQNITMLPPQSPQRLSDILRQHDIYLTASENDPCSNSLIEALACGLPAVARQSGGHLELVQQGGELFATVDEAIPAIDKVFQNTAHYQSHIPTFSISAAAVSYIDFMQMVKKSPRKKPLIFSSRLRGLLLAGTHQGYQIKKALLRSRRY